MPYVKVQGGELYYEEVGQGPAVVLVHGSSGNSDHWYQQVPAIAQAGYRCVRFDMRGFGRSRIEPGQETAGSIAEDIERVRVGLNLGKIFVVGQSNGAEGAMEYALDFKQNTLGIVVATTFRGADAEPAYVALRDKLVPDEVRRRPRVELQLSATYRASNPEGVRKFLEIDAANKRSGPAMPDTVQSRRQPSNYARLSNMTVPTLVVAAEEDILTPPALMRELAAHIPGAEFTVIPKAGRYSFWEQPEAYNQAVLAFFQKHRHKISDVNSATGKFAAIDGAQIYYQDSGSSYRTVVFLHAAASDGDAWQRQVPAFLQAGYRCICLDLRGFGRSRVAPSLARAGSIAQDLQQVAAAIGLGSFFVVGTAYGARGALEFALAQPHKVRGVVIADSTGVDALDTVGEVRGQLLAQPLTITRLEKMHTPALFIAADNDATTPPATVHAVAQRLPSASFAMLSNAEAAAYERPPQWNQVVIDFLDTLA